MVFIPPGVGVVKSKAGLPDSELANTFGILFGALTAVEALSGRKVVDNTFIESTAFGQLIELQMKKQEFGVFETAKILAIRVRIRAVSTGVADSTLRAELLINGITSITAAKKDFNIAEGVGIVEYTALLPGKEVILGQLEEIQVEDLNNLVIRLTALDGANAVRIAKLEVEAIFLPVITERNFFNSSPVARGWIDLGTLSPTFVNNVTKLVDDSITKFYRYSKEIDPLTEFGAAATLFNTVGFWIENAGVYSYTALSLDIGTEHFQVNLLEDGLEKIGLLKGQPTTFDQTLLASYEDVADFDWDDGEIHMVSIDWDETTVRVFTDSDLVNPILQAPRANIAAGTGSPAIEFATARYGPTSSSRGEIVVFSFDYRGFQLGV